MQKDKIIGIILIFFTSGLYGQDSLRIKGQVIDKKTKHGLEYVNIGFQNTPFGCISRTNGEFELPVKSIDILDSTLIISSIGYENLFVKLKEIDYFDKPIILELVPRIYKIENVTIKGTEFKEKEYGVDYNGKGLVQGILRGLEKAYLLPVKKDPVKLKQIRFCVANGSDSISFRLNFYNSLNNKPGSLLNVKNYIYRQEIRKDNWVVCNLQQEDLKFNKDVFIGIELLPELNGEDKVRVAFKSKVGGKGTLYTRNYYDKWEEITG